MKKHLIVKRLLYSSTKSVLTTNLPFVFGRLDHYILLLLCATASALLVHNVSFVDFRPFFQIRNGQKFTRTDIVYSTPKLYFFHSFSLLLLFPPILYFYTFFFFQHQPFLSFLFPFLFSIYLLLSL